ncbi:hypothetical protein [Arthrobacter cryoconiti]|uniref:Uncharacterized protein n=1 Tax=Arthrobacter cryoconiti TaxID=748907 RepID=A0ABV8R355_9MICC|nr:hypothetical protein [Arthrobacter cryoconiti]MCC9068596.1 hypothetical protein [Arthrobacter cryoconiti]
MSKMSDEEMRAVSLWELFLQQLVEMPGLHKVGLNLRSSRFKSHKPNDDVGSGL